MMQDFAATQKVIINRLRSPSSDIGKFSQQAVQSYGQANTKFLLQAAMPIQVNLDLQWPVCYGANGKTTKISISLIFSCLQYMLYA